MIVDRTIRIEFSELSEREQGKLEKNLTYEINGGDVVQSFQKQITRGLYRIPRGAWSILPESVRYVDNRTAPVMPKLKFVGKLDDVAKDPRFKGQRECVDVMFQEEQGLIIRPPGTGKTEIGCAFAAKCGTRTLVLVHTEDILQQWIARVEDVIPELKGKVGIIRGQTVKIGHITIATVQTLQRYAQDRKWWKQWGCVIADEAHHVAAPSWENVLNACPAKYRFGFTASATRADGMHPSMRFIVGPVIHRQKFSSPVKLTVEPVKTGFRFPYRGAFDWQRLVTALVRDPERNKLIARKVEQDIAEGNSVLVLSRRIEHLTEIAELIAHPTEILAAKTRSRKDRHRILKEFRSGKVRCILATQLADEALDVPRLNRVHLTYPGKHEGRIIQQIGRAIRQHPTKQEAVIYDYVDRAGPLDRQWRLRKQTYRKEKISVKFSRILDWGK